MEAKLGYAGLQLGRRGLAAYGLAWLAYLAVFTAVLASVPQYGPLQALMGGVVNVLPPAFLGLVILRRPPLAPWPPDPIHRFLVIHVGTALLFSLATTSATWALFSAIYSIEAGRPSVAPSEIQVITQQIFLGLLAYLVISMVRYVIDIQQNLRRQEARAAEAESLRSKAELEVLRAQLDPHFLFNTLHSLLAVLRSDPAIAEEAIERFARLLRYTLQVRHKGEGRVPLYREWQFVEDYLELESLRLGERLKLEKSVDDDALSIEVPAFLLQPLIENAVKHGVAANPDGATIFMGIRLRGDVVEIEVSDNGMGADPGLLESRGGLGLRLVRERISRLARNAGQLIIDTAPGKGFSAILKMVVET